MKICKFGGSSVCDAVQMRKIRDLIIADPDRRIIVLSAPGKRSPDDVKVTDLLIAAADLRLAGRDAGGEVARIVKRYEEIAVELGLTADLIASFRADLCDRLEADTSNARRFEDSIKAMGERYNAELMAAYLASEGMEASYVDPGEAGLIVTEEYGNAQVKEKSYAQLAKLRDRSGITVFPGFYGISESGHIATFSRGGSDLTGAILAAAVGTEVYENFTDVDGIASADPRVVEDPRIIKEMTYRELRELSYGGFSVFHEEATLPVLEAGIPINIRNTNNPAHSGTWVRVQREPVPGDIVGVACDRGFCGISVRKHLMNREKGFGRRLLTIIEEEDLAFDHMPSGVDSITVLLRQNQLTDQMKRRVKTRIHREMGADQVNFEPDISIISVCGEGMRHTVGLLAKVSDALAKASVNIEIIIQGPSELTLIIGIQGDDPSIAVKAIYDKFFGESS